MASQNGSDIARLRRQIAAEYEAGQRGLSGLAAGVTRHDFIAARMENMGKHFEALTEIVGSKEEAIKILAETLALLPEGGGNALL